MSGTGDSGLNAEDFPQPDRILVLRAEIADLSEELADAERRHRRHFFWTAIGFSPAAVIPAAGIALGQAKLPLAALILLLVTREGWRTVTTSLEARRLRAQLADREDALERTLAEV